MKSQFNIMEFFDTKKEANNKNISSCKKVDVNSKSENSIQFKNRKGRINIYNSNVTIYTHYYNKIFINKNNNIIKIYN